MSSENNIWVKIDKGVNDYENNILIACVYNIPKNSTYAKFCDGNVIDRSEEQLKKISFAISILVGGVFNRRTGAEPDFITEEFWIEKIKFPARAICWNFVSQLT